LGAFSFLSEIFGGKRKAPRTGELLLGHSSSGPADIISFDEETLRGHVFMSGRSGSGMSVLTEQMLTQQTERGAGWLYIDHECNETLLERLRAQAHKHGRDDEFLVLDLDKPDDSNSYDFLRSGTPEQRAVRVVQVLPPAENNPGADFYRTSAYSVLAPLFAAIDATGKTLGLRELALLVEQFDNEAVRQEFLDAIPATHEARASLLAAINSATREARGLKYVLGGISGRLHLLSTLELPHLLNAEKPEIVMSDVLAHNKMLYVRLPLMQRDSTLHTIARLVVHDAITSVFARAHTPARLRKQFLFVMTGFPAYGMSGTSYAAINAAAYTNARAMRVTLIPVVDAGWDSLRSVSESGAKILFGNTYSKIYFHQHQDEHTGRCYPELAPGTLDALTLGEFVMWNGSHHYRGMLANSPAEVLASIRTRRSVAWADGRPRLELASLIDRATT
jgi:hypothetical protein